MSLGLLLAFVCSLLWTAVDAVRKDLAEALPTTSVLVGLHLYQLPWLGLLMAWGYWRSSATAHDDPWTLMLGSGIPDTFLEASYLVPASISWVASLFAMMMFLKALQLSPLSLTVPYLAFTPIFSAIGEWAVLGQSPTLSGSIGIGLVGIGAFFLNPGDIKTQGILAPFKALWTERGSVYMLAVSAGWSVSAIYDSQAALASSAVWHTLFIALGLMIPVTVFRMFKDKTWRPLWSELNSKRWTQYGAATLLIGAMVVQMTAYNLWGVARVETLKRAIGIIGSIVIGYIVFKEENVRQRLFAALIISVGVAILLLGDQASLQG